NNIYDGVKARETLFLYEVVNRLKNDRKIIREAFGRKTDVRVSAESVIFKYMTEKEKKIVSAKAVKEALFEEVTFLIGSSLLTKDSTRDGAIEFLNKKFFRFFGMNPERAERIVDSKIGRTILIAAVAPFAELSELMGIFDASEAADEAEKQKGLKDEGARDRRRFANELLTNFLDGHKGYRAGYESDPMIGINEKQKKYWTGAKKIIKASASAYNVVLKLTRVRAIARLAAKIANVISHSAVNLSQPDTALTQDRAEATIEKIIEKFQQYGVTVIPETTEYTNSAKIYFNEFFNNIRFMRSQENIDRFLKAFVEVLRTEKKLDVDIRSVFDFTADTVKGDAILEFSARGIILHINPVVQNKAFYEEKMALVLDIFERALKNTYFDSLPDEVIEKNEESGIKEAEAESPIRDVETAKKFLENEISSPKSIFEKYNPDGSNIELTDAEADEIEQIVVIAKENVRADRTPTTIFLTLQRRGFIVKGAFSGQWTSQKTKNEFAAKYFNNIYYGIKAREILLKYESVLNSEDVVSAGAMAALSDSLARYVALLKAALRNFIIGKSTVDIKAPELKGKSATIVTAEYTPDIMSRARTLAAQGIDVNIIMPYDIELPEEIGAATQYMSYVYSDERSSAAVWQYCEKDSSFGKNINIYMYDQTDMPAGRRAEAGIDPNIVYAQKTLEWLKEQSLKRGEYNFGIIDIHPNTGINYELAQNMFPDSVIVHSVSKTSSSMETLESSKPGYMPYYEGQEESLIITAGEQLRNRNKNSYMKTSPIFSTTIDISKMPLTDFNSDAELSELKSYGFDTMVIKLDETNTVSDIETLRNVLTRAHKKNIKVVIEYAFADYAAFESWTASLGSQLASFRASTNIVQGAKEFVDGIRLDLSQMSDADAKKASEKFLAVRRIISAESADAVFGVKSSYYDEALYQAAKIRPVRTISHENKDALNMAGNAWVEFSVGKESYDQQSLDYDITSQDIEKVVTAKTTDIVGIDYDIIKALKKSEDIPFSALNMLRNVFLQRVAAFRNTPEGTFNSARALAVRQNVFVSRSDEAVLYRSLAELRAGKNVSAAADAIASILTGSALMADLALQLKNANEENAALIIKNIEGYVQGALENTEITNYEKQSGKKINYVIKTNKDMLGQMLVEAKLALSARGIDAAMKINKASEDVPYGIELNPRSDEESLRILRNENNEQLEKVIDLLNSLDAVPATEAFAIIQEAINILNSLVESEALSENAKPIALSELLALLALKADFMPGNIVDTTSEGMRNIAANTRAVLAAA
ncbi:MAG: hypothetical protein LBL00_09065, partial [Endomicrobium sp.]|nr:hypothetical protein [Endomicrobium sp.]